METGTVKRVIANYYGHEIIVENTWFHGAKLLIDGECRADSHDTVVLDKKKPVMTATFEADGQTHTVEVFVRAILTVDIKICVDGKQFGGEIF